MCHTLPTMMVILVSGPDMCSNFDHLLTNALTHSLIVPLHVFTHFPLTNVPLEAETGW